MNLLTLAHADADPVRDQIPAQRDAIAGVKDFLRECPGSGCSLRDYQRRA